MKCKKCSLRQPKIKRPRDGAILCKECFYEAFESEVHEFIIRTSIFKRGERVALGASGGKDSTVLASVMKTLNERYDYGLDLFLLSIDEGIKGYRDDSLKTVERNAQQYNMPLRILSYKQLYNWTMDEIVAKVGHKSNCTFCGVFRRQALDRGAVLEKADVIATGHNADDVAETILLNFLRGDFSRLTRCTLPRSQTTISGYVPRCKPLLEAYEKEIVLYARFKGLDYFSTECIYSPEAFRGYPRMLIKDYEHVRSRSILDIIESARMMNFHSKKATKQTPHPCSSCGYVSSQKLCKACVLLRGLGSNDPMNAVYGKTQDFLNDNASNPSTSTQQSTVIIPQTGTTLLSPINGESSNLGLAPTQVIKGKSQ